MGISASAAAVALGGGAAGVPTLPLATDDATIGAGVSSLASASADTARVGGIPVGGGAIVCPPASR